MSFESAWKTRKSEKDTLSRKKGLQKAELHHMDPMSDESLGF